MSIIWKLWTHSLIEQKELEEESATNNLGAHFALGIPTLFQLLDKQYPVFGYIKKEKE